MADVARIVLRRREIDELNFDPAIVRTMDEYMDGVVFRARANAPRSPRGSNGRPSGYLASNIVRRDGEDSLSSYVDAVSTARTPSGFNYGRLMERRRPYLRPALY